MKKYGGFVYLANHLLIGCQPKSLPAFWPLMVNTLCLKYHTKRPKQKWIHSHELLAKNIVLDLSGTTYLKEGTLQQLKFAVMLADGTIGTKSADLVGLQVQVLFLNTTPNQSLDLGLGHLNKIMPDLWPYRYWWERSMGGQKLMRLVSTKTRPKQSKTKPRVPEITLVNKGTAIKTIQ